MCTDQEALFGRAVLLPSLAAHLIDPDTDGECFGQHGLREIFSIATILPHNAFECPLLRVHIVDHLSSSESDDAFVGHSPGTSLIRCEKLVQDIEFKAYLVVVFENIDFSSFGCRVEIEGFSIVTETEGNNVGAPLMAESQTTDPAPLNDSVYGLPIRNLTITSSHAGTFLFRSSIQRTSVHRSILEHIYQSRWKTC